MGRAIQLPAPADADPAAPAPGHTEIALGPTLLHPGGQCTTIHWMSRTPREVYLLRPGRVVEDHGVTGKEDRLACPPASRSHYLRSGQDDWSVETREVRIEVARPLASAPVVTYVHTDPSGSIVLGACVRVSWEATGSIDRVQVTYNNQTIWNYAPVRGSMGHCPTMVGGASYAIIATGRRQYDREHICRRCAGRQPSAPVTRTAALRNTLDSSVLQSRPATTHRRRPQPALRDRRTDGGGDAYVRYLSSSAARGREHADQLKKRLEILTAVIWRWHPC